METYRPQRVCSSLIRFEIKDDYISRVEFKNGCEGNLKGISALVQGMHIDDAIRRLRGINCGGKGTSCPDQLSKALREYREKQRSHAR